MSTSYPGSWHRESGKGNLSLLQEASHFRPCLMTATANLAWWQPTAKYGLGSFTPSNLVWYHLCRGNTLAYAQTPGRICALVTMVISVGTERAEGHKSGRHFSPLLGVCCTKVITPSQKVPKLNCISVKAQEFLLYSREHTPGLWGVFQGSLRGEQSRYKGLLLLQSEQLWFYLFFSLSFWKRFISFKLQMKSKKAAFVKKLKTGVMGRILNVMKYFILHILTNVVNISGMRRLEVQVPNHLFIVFYCLFI